MRDNESAIVSLRALLLGLCTFNLLKEKRKAVLQLHLSVHKPLDIFLLMIYHDRITQGLLAMQHYATYFKVPPIHK